MQNVTSEKRIRRKNTIKEQRAAYICLIPAFLGLSLITYIPLLAAFGIAFTNLRTGHFMPTSTIGPVEFVGFQNFIDIFESPLIDFGNSIKVTVFYALFAVVASVVYSTIIALLLNRKMPGRGFFRSIFYLPYILPAAAVVITWNFLLTNQGIVNYALNSIGLPSQPFFASSQTVIPTLVLIAIWQCGNLIVIFLAGLQNVPRVYHEAAEMDGANAWHRLLHITIPCMTPIIFYNMLMALVVNLQIYVPALSLTRGGPGTSTMFMTYIMYHTGFRQGQLGIASAIAVVFFIIAAILAFILFASSNKWIFYEGGDSKK